MVKICIISHFAYGAFAGGCDGHAGGVERQTTLMANWLAQRGYKVSLVTWDEGQPDGSDMSGITNYTLCKQSDGIPLLRFFYPRWTSLIKALRRADADLYYHNCAEYATGQVALWCKLNKKKFVFSVPSDPDCDADLPKMKSFREKVLYKYGLRNSDALIVQTLKQQGMLERHFGLSSTVIPMPCPVPIPCRDEGDNDGSIAGKRVIWVGRISREKQLELLLDVAELLPDVQFTVAGKPKNEDEYVSGLLSRVQGMNNVELLGMVPRERMDGLYHSASLLCCTSHYEGFPNTFLEAWSHGVPVVSTVDPDGVIDRFGLGQVAATKEDIANCIDHLLNSHDVLGEYSKATKEYFMRYHTLDSAMGEFEKIFNDVLSDE